MWKKDLLREYMRYKSLASIIMQAVNEDIGRLEYD